MMVGCEAPPLAVPTPVLPRRLGSAGAVQLRSAQRRRVEEGAMKRLTRFQLVLFGLTMFALGMNLREPFMPWWLVFVLAVTAGIHVTRAWVGITR